MRSPTLTRALAALAVTCAAFAATVTLPLACNDDTTVSPPLDAGPDATTQDGDSDATSVVPKGSRILGLSVAIGTADFENNVQTARDAGARSTSVALAWDDVERPYDAGLPDAAGGDSGGPSDAATPTQLFEPLLHIANLVLSSDRTQAILAIDALDVGGSRAPAELATLAFDDAALRARYDRLTDYALASVADLDVTALFIASSVDVALGDDPAQYAAFATFVGSAAAHARSVRPGLKIGFTVTADGIDARRARLAAAWEASDVVGVTYLPVDARGRVRPPSGVLADLDRVVGAAPASRPIFLAQAGYPTSAECGSDEATQAAFVSALFVAWDRHAGRIPVLTLRELDDAPLGSVALEAARYRRTDLAFLGFLGSLGVRAADGRGKPGLLAFVREARARGF